MKDGWYPSGMAPEEGSAGRQEGANWPAAPDVTRTP